MESMLHKHEGIPSKTPPFLRTDYLSLAPDGFFTKQMNMGKEALGNFFMFWRNALVSFLNGEYISHDALVGENACHIRTCALIDIAESSNDHFQSTLLNIVFELTRINLKLECLAISSEDTKLSVREFLIKNNFIFSFPVIFQEKIKYIIDTFLLTLTKESFPSSGITLCEKTTYQPVRNWGFAYNRAQFLVHNTQKSLSAQSCSYVMNESTKLDKPLDKFMIIKRDAHGRSFLPQFFVAKVLFLRALEENRYLLLKVTRYLKNSPIDNAILWFKPNDSKTEFALCKPPLENSPCIVTSGAINYQTLPESMEEYQKRLLSFSLLEIILANFAIHPQYSGELKDLPPPFEEIIARLTCSPLTLESDHLLRDHEESTKTIINEVITEQTNFNKSKQFALQHGCALENPGLFFINHMFCDLPHNYIQNVGEHSADLNNPAQPSSYTFRFITSEHLV